MKRLLVGLFCGIMSLSMTSSYGSTDRLVNRLHEYYSFDGSRCEQWESDRTHYEENQAWRDIIRLACR